MYDKGLSTYLFYQMRSDLLNGNIELAEEGGQFSSAMGLALLDMMRIKSQTKNNSAR